MKMVLILFATVIIFLSNTAVKGQQFTPSGLLQIRVKVESAGNLSPLSYASLRIISTGYGTSVNKAGIGQLIIDQVQTPYDSIEVSCIGYLAKKIPLIKLDTNEINPVQLQPDFKLLKPVFISNNIMSAEEIMKRAIASIPDNFIPGDFSGKVYMRQFDLQNQDTLRDNEFVAELFCKNGYSGKAISKQSITEEKWNRKIAGKEKYGNSLHYFTRNINVLDFARNIEAIFTRPFFDINALSRFTFILKETIHLNDLAIYSIGFEQTDKDIEEMNRTRDVPAFKTYGRIYVNAMDFAILKYESWLEYAEHEIPAFTENQIIFLQNGRHYIAMTYTKNGNYYQPYYSINRLEELDSNTVSSQRFKFTGIYEHYFFDLHPTSINEKKFKQIKPSQLQKFNQETYNKEFWNRFNRPSADLMYSLLNDDE
jgi:hypothetical protein